MANASKARGTSWETALVKYLREQKLEADRLRQTGTNDEGDIALLVGDTWPLDRYVIEAKATARLDLASFVGQAELEAENYAKHRGIETPGFVVAYKRRQHSVGKSYVITTLDEWLRQIT